MLSCNWTNCANWDSDIWGGHCMICLPRVRTDKKTGERSCKDFVLEEQPKKTKKKQSKKTLE